MKTTWWQESGLWITEQEIVDEIWEKNKKFYIETNPREEYGKVVKQRRCCIRSSWREEKL